MNEKPDHLEIITREELIETVLGDLSVMLEGINNESAYIIDDHDHNSGTAYILADMFSDYANKVQDLIRVRSAPKEHYNFFRDTKTGHIGFKHHRQTWETIGSLDSEKPAPTSCKHDHGPSGTETAYR